MTLKRAPVGAVSLMLALANLQWQRTPDSEVVIDASANLETRAVGNVPSEPLHTLLKDDTGYDCRVGIRAKKIRREARRVRESRQRASGLASGDVGRSGDWTIWL